MSLIRTEVSRPGVELAANLERAGIPREQVAADLGFTARRLTETVRVGPAADPADVWLLRDYLDRTIRVQGRVPEPWVALDETARLRAAHWFALRTPAQERRAS